MYNFGEKFGTPTTYTYGYSTGAWGDQLTSFNGASITYDAVGNPLTYYNGSTFGWTGRRLTSATKGGKSYTFTYDDGGIRQSKTKDGKTTTYYYDGGKLIAERNNDAAVIYIYDELGRPLGCRVFVFETDATFNAGYYVYDYWYVCNLQGDVVEMLDTNGNTVAIFSYDPYGNITSKAYSKGSPFAAYSNLYYRGYYYDRDLELYYLNSRYYDANTGRFVNADGYVSTGQDILGTNMFAYCGNNPVNRCDPNGEVFFTATMCGVTAWKIGAALIALVATVAVTDSVTKNPPAFPKIEVKPKSDAKPKVEEIVPGLPKLPAKDPTHHIVAKKDPRAEEARQILRDVGIEPVTDQRNLVVLPQSYHVSLHTNAYYNYINERFRQVAGDAAGVEATLIALKVELLFRSAFGIRWD